MLHLNASGAKSVPNVDTCEIHKKKPLSVYTDPWRTSKRRLPANGLECRGMHIWLILDAVDPIRRLDRDRRSLRLVAEAASSRIQGGTCCGVCLGDSDKL